MYVWVKYYFLKYHLRETKLIWSDKINLNRVD